MDAKGPGEAARGPGAEQQDLLLRAEGFALRAEVPKILIGTRKLDLPGYAKP